MVRRPVSLDRSPCFSTHRKDADCTECPDARSCMRLCDFFEKQRTVEEYVNLEEHKLQKTPRLRPKEAIAFFLQEYKHVGGRAREAIRFSKQWYNAMDSIIRTCNDVGIDPRLYIRAQIETIGAWAARNAKPFYANMMSGANAQKRFEEWIEKNGEQYADHHRLPEHNVLDFVVSAEMFFADVYFTGVSAEEASQTTKGRYPKWRLKYGRREPYIRLKALQTLLSSIDPLLPRRVTLSGRVWKWGTVRREISCLLS